MFENPGGSHAPGGWPPPGFFSAEEMPPAADAYVYTIKLLSIFKLIV